MKAFSPYSKVWIYQANRKLSNDEQVEIKESLNTFTTEWTAHNLQLHAAAEIVYDHFIVLSVDSKSNQASGCSIDKSVQFLKLMEQKYQLDLFNRMNVGVYNEENIVFVPFNQLSQAFEQGIIQSNSKIFDLSISKMSEYRLWPRPLRETWLYDRLKSDIIAVQANPNQ